ncbi:hypothetical protein NM208_g16359 [Fusarium decemcellulare]|uniref:Uncharacterized protein n=1 Tax=Fusarium decemcellulare TaxID=57161 RepID=A0ACC1RAE4_9HYPO|nr:hypothetical protein NM208_g16359 [Fusarium decemcellulare]
MHPPSPDALIPLGSPDGDTCTTRESRALPIDLSNTRLEKDEQYPFRPTRCPHPTVHHTLADVVLGLCASSPRQPITHGIPEPDHGLGKDDVLLSRIARRRPRLCQDMDVDPWAHPNQVRTGQAWGTGTVLGPLEASGKLTCARVRPPTT